MTTYVIGDTHFNHKNILKFAAEERPFATLEEHNNELIARWNSVVDDEDTVYHLGDFALGYKTNPQEYLSQLKGRKILIAGYHDVYWTTQQWLDWGFEEVRGCVEYSSHILTHIPVHRSQAERFSGNIHGHLHSNSLGDPWYFCASAEHTDLKPFNIDVAMKMIKKQLLTWGGP